MSDTRTRDELLEEIGPLEDELQALSTEVQDLSSENSGLREDNAELERRVRELEGEIEDRKEPRAAIEVFVDELTRPCGSRKFTIPDNPRVHDAIRAMADAIGRNV